MRPASALFAATVTGPHQLAVECTSRFGTGDEVPLPITDGSVTADRTRLVRRELSATVPGREWVEAAEDPEWQLSPYGGEITCKRGIRWPNGDIELIQLGVFVIQNAQLDRLSGQVSVAAADRFVRLVDDRFEAPRKPAANASTVQVIRSLIQETIPGATVTATGVTDRAYAGLSIWDEDRAQAVADLAKALAAECYADADGSFVIRPVPAHDDPSVLTIAEGPGGVLVNAPTDVTRDGVYNAVVARSEPADEDSPLITATVRDTNVTSPTKWGGPFGRKPRFYTSPMLATLAQAQAAARAILADSIGARKTINFDMVPDPRLEVGDVITIDYLTGTDETHIPDSLTIPLSATGNMGGETRALADPEGVA